MDSRASGFTARSPRLAFNAPVVFYFDGGEVRGHSVNISESGMLAVFDAQLDGRLVGKLSAVVGEWHINIRARVVRIEGRVAAFAFRDVNETDRVAIQTLIEHAKPNVSGCNLYGWRPAPCLAETTICRIISQIDGWPVLPVVYASNWFHAVAAEVLAFWAEGTGKASKGADSRYDFG
jgi:hypothetical protein